MTELSTSRPTASTVVELPDGRVLALAETGSRAGAPVVFLHSAPGSRVFDPDPAVTVACAVRLITVDRPGYGGSTALPEGAIPTLARMADDVAVALRRLGVVGAGVIGWSAGGRVAVALAARHPELVRSVAIVGTPAPHDEVPWIPSAQADQLRNMRADPARGYLTLAGLLAERLAATGAVPELVAGTPADQSLLVDAHLRARVSGMLAEAFRTGTYGSAADVIAAEAVPWGFDLSAVAAPLGAFYGAADAIPTEAGSWYVERVGRGRLHIVPAAGHLVVVAAWREILAALSP